MRKLSLIILLFIAASTIGVSAQENNTHRFAIKSGHIEYKLEGSTVGTKSVWFDDYGDIYYEEIKATTTVKMFGMKNVEEVHSITIQNRAIFYSINVIEGDGVKSNQSYYTSSQELMGDMTQEEQDQLGKDILQSLGGEITGEEKILGKTCEIVSVLGSHAWVYKGVTLKSDASILGIKNQEEAISFDEGINFPEKLLTPPKDIEIKDLSDVTYNYEESGYYDDDADEDEYEEDEEIVPVKMPFETFKKGIEDVSRDGFTRFSVITMDGQHMAIYTKTIVESFTIIASSIENMENNPEEMENYETFTKNGKKMFYGKETEEGATVSVLGVEYPKEETAIIIAATFPITKQELISIASMLKF